MKMKKGPDPKHQLSCSYNAAWPAVFIQLYTLLSQILQHWQFLLSQDKVTKKIDEVRVADIVNMGFSEAFNKVPHGRLVSK
eukprot:g41216.t1